MACVMFLCTTALAADIVASGDCSYDLDDDKVTWTLYSDGKLKINGYGSMANYDDNNRPPWEAYTSSIETVSVSRGVSSLGAYAFYNCKSLKRVTIDSALTINKYAFANSSVKEIQLPPETRTIDPTAFSGCTYLVEIKCGDNMYHYHDFPDGNFPTSYYTLISYLCQGRQFVKYSPNRSGQYKCSIPNAMTSIAPYAFADLQYLNEVGIPASVQEIGANAFSGDSLKDVVFFGEAPQDVADNAFAFDGTIHCFCRYADSFRESSLYSKDDAGNETWCSLPLQADLHEWGDGSSGACTYCGTAQELTFRNAFPDPVLRYSIIRLAFGSSNIPSDNDVMTTEQISLIVNSINNGSLNRLDSWEYSSAEGIRFFLAKATGSCEVVLFDEYLQTLDLSGCPALWALDCSGNQLKRLDIDSMNYRGLEYLTVRGQHIYDETPVLQGDRYNKYRFNIKDLLGEDIDLSRVEITDQNATLNKETGEVTYQCRFSANSTTGEVTYGSAPTAVHYKYDTGFAYADNGEEVWMDVTWTPQQILPADVLIKKRGQCGNKLGNKLYYEFDSAGVLTITGSGDMWDYYDDPQRFGTIPWAGLNIKKLVVGEGCTSICEKAFWNKNTIEEAVFLCDTLTIKKNAFTNCGDLKSADFSKCGSLTLGDYAFASCTQLSCITFNDGDTAVIKPGQYVFDYCLALSTVHLPKGVTMDGSDTSGLGMFTGCNSLKTATVDCAFIGPFTFECRNLERITFTDPNVQFYYFHEGKGGSGHPINVECQTELVGYDCSEVHKLVNQSYKPDGVSLTFTQIEGDSGKHKDVTTVPGVEATCTTTGLTEGKRCSFCDTWTVPQEVIPTLPHTLVTDPGFAPTIGKAGKTDGSHCSVCKNVIVSQEDIPAWVTAAKYEGGQLTVTVSDDAKGQLILAAYRKNGQLSRLFLPAASSSGTYTLAVDATADFKWKAFFTDSAFAPAQYAYELSL